MHAANDGEFQACLYEAHRTVTFVVFINYYKLPYYYFFLILPVLKIQRLLLFYELFYNNKHHYYHYYTPKEHGTLYILQQHILMQKLSEMTLKDCNKTSTKTNHQQHRIHTNHNNHDTRSINRLRPYHMYLE